MKWLGRCKVEFRDKRPAVELHQAELVAEAGALFVVGRATGREHTWPLDVIQDVSMLVPINPEAT